MAESRLDAAGLAFACAYSSADEYEAELIRLARERGAFRKTAPRHGMAWSGALIALAAAFLIAL
ncbi:MAG: hypothetical protein HXY30_01300 [Pseudorhodoplanes sp.]|nr:hypothetical protein [Pseudorhodoplanes sp.]